MNDCVFCKIAKKEIPSYVVYEDNDVLAFLDLSQATKGHTLVVSKRHSDTILDMEEQDLIRVTLVAREIARKMIKVLPGVKGINILNNCGKVAGQAINHTHVHVVPRYAENDLTMSFIDHTNCYDLQKIARLLKMEK